MKISTVLAVYNEKENIIELLERLVEVFVSCRIDYEIVLVIQGADGTFGLVQEWQQKRHVPLCVVYFNDPIGVGAAFKTGFHNISADVTHVLTMDADLNHQPEDLPRFIKAQEENGADIIIGSRYIPGGEMKNVLWWRFILSKAVNIAFSYLSRVKVKDKSSGYRLQRKEAVFLLRDKIKSKNFEFYIEYLLDAQENGFSMYEIPITFIARVRGKSKMNTVNTLLCYCRMLLRRFICR